MVTVMVGTMVACCDVWCRVVASGSLWRRVVACDTCGACGDVVACGDVWLHVSVLARVQGSLRSSMFKSC